MHFFLNICHIISGLSIVQGEHLLRGSRLVDFDIRLGDAVCVPVSLTDNQVDCRPPTSRPNRHVNDTFCQRDTLSLKASHLRPGNECESEIDLLQTGRDIS